MNTNKGIVFVEKHGDKALVISMIDNLLKGASGQAVQNMNLALGLARGCWATAEGGDVLALVTRPSGRSFKKRPKGLGSK